MAPGELRKLSREAIGYGLVSVVALGADMGLLHGLVDGLKWHYLVASAIAFLGGATVSYLLSVRFVFPVRKVQNHYLECIAFFTLGLVGLAVNAAALFVAVGKVGLGLTAGKLFAAGCTFATNFILRRQLLFSPTRTAVPAPADAAPSP
jgi:putative flippase GtrA